MDDKILKVIVNNGSNEEVSKNAFIAKDEFPPVSNDIINKVSSEFTKLLTYRVSQEVHQRYSVRLNVINILRNWCQLKGDIKDLPIFYKSEQSNNFLFGILKKHLTPEVLVNCNNVDDLLHVSVIFLNFLNDESCKKDLAKVIQRITEIEQTEKSKKFLQYVIENCDSLNLNSSLVDEIFVSQKSIFIEQPLIDCYVEYCSKQATDLSKLELLFEKIVGSPTLFQLASIKLKEFFVTTSYSEESQKFIQLVLEKVKTHCDKYNKDTIDLYPSCLQFCVILLRIEPKYHTVKSKNHAVKSLKQVLLKDYNDALILVSHFPAWLPEYLQFFKELTTHD